MTRGEVDDAERRALNLLDKWNNVTGFIVKHTSYYYEVQSLMKDAVHCGIQAALDDYKPLDGEEDD